MARVSVVIPTYNRPKLLMDAVQSVLAQTYTDFEVIVVDDGSEAEQEEQLRRINGERVRYIHQEHAGRSEARNRGIAEAQGELISFLDDDDLYLPQKLAAEVAFLDAHPEVDLVAEGRSLTTPIGENITVLRPWEDYPEATLLALLDECLFATCSIMIRKKALEGMDSWFDPSLERLEDWDFYLRLALTGARMEWLTEIMSICRGYREEPFTELVVQHRFGKKVLDGLFTRPDLPLEVRERQKYAYSNFYMECACRAYGCRCNLLAQKELLLALLAEPNLVNGHQALLFNEIARFARSPYWRGTPDEYVDFVFDHLPAPLAGLSSKRKQVMYMAAGVTKRGYAYR